MAVLSTNPAVWPSLRNSALNTRGAHPVSIVWETGLFETLSDRITCIHKTKLFKKLLKWVIKAAAKHIGNVDSRGPSPLLDSNIDEQLSKERPFEDIDIAMAGARGGNQTITKSNLAEIEKGILAALEEEAEILNLDITSLGPLGNRLLEGKAADEANTRGAVSAILIKDLAKMAVAVLRRYLKGNDHGFYPTVVEEVLQKYFLADIGDGYGTA